MISDGYGDNEKMKPISEHHFNKLLKDKEKKVFYFGTEHGCKNCVKFKRDLAKISELIDCSIYWVNPEEQRKITSKFCVSSLPTFFVAENGQMQDMFVGYNGIEWFVGKVNL